MLNRLKIAAVDWIMRTTPGLRRHHALHRAERARNDMLARQLTEMAAELREVSSERDALFRGMTLLLDERVAHPRT